MNNGGGQRSTRLTARRLALVAIALATLAAMSSPARAQDEPDVDTILPAAATSAESDAVVQSPSLKDQISRSSSARFVRLSTREIDAQLSAGTLTIQLDPNTAASFTVIDSTTGPGAFSTIIARNPDTDETATIVRRGEVVSMSLDLAGGRWHITPATDNLHLITREGRPVEIASPTTARRLLAPRPLLDDLPPGVARHVIERVAVSDGVTTVVTAGAPATGPTARIPGPTTALAAGPATSVINMMIWYDDPTLNFYGSTVAAEAAIVTSVGAANAAFLASGIDASIAISELSQVAFTGSGNSFNDLTNLRAKYDGVLDEAHVVRDATDSDLVALVTVLNDGFCGRADLLQQLPSINTDDQAFSIIHAGCLTNDTYTHEIGHNMGAAHDDANTFGSDGVFPWSRGYVDPVNQFVTLMSIPNGASGCFGCTSISQFSSSTATWAGFATGDVDHDNAETLEQTRIGIANYRPSPCPPPANDDYPVRHVLPSTSLATAIGTNVCATVENLETFFLGTEPVESVWYEWTAPFDGMATFSTCAAATDFDTALTVYDSDPVFANLTVLGHNNDAGTDCAINPSQSTVLVPVTMGEPYRFKVDGAGAANGNFEVWVQINTTCNALPVTVYLDRGDSPTSADDVVLGTDGPDVIDSLEGDDLICAGAGNDIVTGGIGADTLMGEGGDDTLNGQEDDDVLFGGAGADLLFGGLDLGADEIHGGDGDDFILGFGGDDDLRGDAGSDTIFGGNGNDTIDAGSGDDARASGGPGDDIVNGGAGADLLYGNEGIDTLDGGAGPDVINGGGGNDIVVGGDGDDTIFGLGGNDTLAGGAGADLLYGMTGADTIDGGAGDDQIWGNENDDIITDPAGANIINGGGGDDNITGGLDADIIYGDGTFSQQGADTIDGGPGMDTLYAFAGNDSFTSTDGEVDIINALGIDLATTSLPDTDNDQCLADLDDFVWYCENVIRQ